MIRSIWRLSHLTLALVASLFLIFAAVSGIFLAYEPVANKQSAPAESAWNQLPIANVVDSVRQNYLEVFTLEKDENGFLTASVLTDDAEAESFKLNPISGKKSGDITKKTPFFEWMTTFHRSLFLDTLGRFFVGLAAVILCFIAISGLALIIQRSNSIKSLFDKVEKTLAVQFYHIVFGRLVFIPIIIISLTGAYLFLQRFELIKTEEQPVLTVDLDAPPTNLGKFDFSTTTLEDIEKIEFPFSPDEEDYFVVKTATEEIAVHQYDYNILASNPIPQSTQLATLSLNLHTGRTNSIWAIILGLSALSILYFIYSGFKMTYLKWKSKTRNKYKLAESTILILTGSEQGNTKKQAKLVYEQLVVKGHKVYITELNNYQPSSSIEHLIVFTSTYGVGEAPASGSSFSKKWNKQPLAQPFSYSVVGFGSLAYPDFCQFAVEVHQLLKNTANATELLPVVKIHNQSYHSVKTWATDWKNASGLSFEMPASIQVKQLPLHDFSVIDKSLVSEDGHDTFILTLKASTSKFQSGDLLAIYPTEDPFERFYSIGKIAENQLTISVKKHEFGVASRFLHALSIGDNIKAGIKSNPEFHYQKNKPAIFIGNGTGMGPFLGMVTENKHKHPAQLYWGGRTAANYSLYEPALLAAKEQGQLAQLHIALSRESATKEYVGNFINRDAAAIAQHLKVGGIIYICGSLAMQQDVIAELEQATQTHLKKSISYFQKRQQVKMDCY